MTISSNIQKTRVTAAAEQLTQAFDKGPIGAFKTFINANPLQRRWIIASDYNWRDPKRPQNALGFTIFPETTNIATLAAEMARLFPRDFKKIQTIPEDAINWFRQANAFHLIVALEKHATLLIDQA